MSYIILCDSCADLTPELKANKNVVSIPLTITVDDKEIIDDATFDQADFLARMKASKEVPKSSCPAPDEYLKHFDEADEVYAVTLSGNLSGSYGSAKVAADMYEEENPSKKVHIFDSCSACAGETLLVLKRSDIRSYTDVILERYLVKSHIIRNHRNRSYLNLYAKSAVSTSRNCA